MGLGALPLSPSSHNAFFPNLGVNNESLTKHGVKRTVKFRRVFSAKLEENEKEEEPKKEKSKQSLFGMVTDALDFSQVRSEEDALLLDEAREATKSGEKMNREQYGALRRKIGGTYKDFFKSYVDDTRTLLPPDLCGYGDTDAPPSATSYTVFHMIGDLVSFLDSLDLHQIFLVGHDWGAINLSELRLEPGEVEEKFASCDTGKIISAFLSSRDTRPPVLPKELDFNAIFQAPIALPSWLTEEDINYYAGKFNQTGFTGGLNY